MPRICVVLLLALAACRNGTIGEVTLERRAADPQETPAPPPLLFQSPEADCTGFEPRRVGGRVQPPVLLHRVEPVFPEELKKAMIQGVVILEVILNAEGRVCSIRLLRGVHPRLDRAAAEAVRQRVFRPALYDGRPEPVAYAITVSFDLPD